MTNYQNSKIYKIKDNLSDMIYVGSTCKTLEQRLKQHERNFKAFNAGKSNNVTVFKILVNNDYKIELVESYPCATKQDLNIREGQIIKECKKLFLNIVNRCIAGQTKKESSAQFRKNNRNLINEKQNQKHNCQCGGKYSQCHKSIHEKTKKHCSFINNSKTINIETLNLNITVNNVEELNEILKTINKLKYI